MFSLCIRFATTIILLMLSGPGEAEVNLNRLSGADLGMGIGARAIGMAGAFTSMADDASAIYWNPAGLTQLGEPEVLVEADILAGFSAAALTYAPQRPWLLRHKVAVGLGVVNRLSFKGDSGNGTWEGYPSHLLDVAMIDIDPDFSGRINTRTYDARLSVATTIPRLPQLALGLNLAHIW